MEDKGVLERALKVMERNLGHDDFEAITEMLEDRLSKLREMNDESEGIYTLRLQGAIGEVKRLISMFKTPAGMRAHIDEEKKREHAVKVLGGIQ